MSQLARTLRDLTANPDFVNLCTIEGVQIDLRYGRPDNFMGRDVYSDFREAFLHRLAAEKLARAMSSLRQRHPGFSIIVFDALRPRSVQRVLWDHVRGTHQEAYVANPDRGSMHNYGMAIDLSVLDHAGRELDMGTGFDAFVPLSEPRREAEYLASGALKPEQHRNRLILRECMELGGFKQLEHEWWHYDALPGERVRREFQIIE